jgi:hypothetical protein
MDNNILSIIAIVISVGSVIIGAINHTRIRSTCCDKEIQASIDIERTTPPSS